MLSYLLYGFLWMGSLLPLRVLYIFADVCYYINYYIIKYRRNVVRKNLCNAFPEKDIAEIVQIEKRYYRHLCDLFVEMYRMWHMPEKTIRRRCFFKNPEVIRHYLDQGKSVIGVLGHYGNWEWMASYSLWLPADVDFFMLYKPLHEKLFDRLMYKIRSRFRAKPVPMNDILRYILKNRQAGRLFLAGFIGDQTPNRDNLNFWMDFLHQETPVLTGTEKIARKFNLPVISLRMRKVKRGYYEVEFYDLCAEPNKLAPGELTVMHTRMLEKYIQEEPELWLWSHKRWKHRRTNVQDEK